MRGHGKAYWQCARKRAYTRLDAHAAAERVEQRTGIRHVVYRCALSGPDHGTAYHWHIAHDLAGHAPPPRNPQR